MADSDVRLLSLCVFAGGPFVSSAPPPSNSRLPPPYFRSPAITVYRHSVYICSSFCVSGYEILPRGPPVDH
ncbi:hypothetical protein BV25DRAFT_1922918 [Artomyces pyxidatus]|uniref:Uncharacterized protein n=1 Tax=Artomyces pyxidatus TaxID=48021 RepID=A0ACB8SCC3_9AGAM|nr:hypothetical protein BV25DRAFT_1922918 [Artomyces pyxidatus]